MSQPDEVTLWRYAVKWPDGSRVYSTPALYYADSHPIPPDDPAEPGIVEVFKALPAAAYLALLSRVEAAEGALADAVDMLTDREVVPVMLDENAIVRIQRMRDALRASGTREGA